MSLNTLPAEIIFDILGHFKKNIEDRKSLAALSRSSHRLYTLTIPFLYHTPFPSSENNSTYSPTNNARLPLLFRSLLRNPALGKLVIHMNLFDRNVICQFGEGEMDALADDDWMLVARACGDICTAKPFDEGTVERDNPGHFREFEERCCIGVREGKWDALAVLTLSCLPNLEHLTVEGWRSFELACEGYRGADELQNFMVIVAESQEGLDRETSMSDNTWGTAPLLPKCRTVSLYSYENEDSSKPYSHVPPFPLPSSVQDFTANDVEIDIESWNQRFRKEGDSRYWKYRWWNWVT